MPRINPTVGRVVHFHPGDVDKLLAGYPGPLAAVISDVVRVGCDGDPEQEVEPTFDLVNVGVFHPNGTPIGRTNVILKQADSPESPANVSYCEWMPFQIGQAATLSNDMPDIKKRIAAIEATAVADDLDARVRLLEGKLAELGG